MQVNYKRYGLYLLRWQAPHTRRCQYSPRVHGLLGCSHCRKTDRRLIFFWGDLFIFTSQSLAAQWEVKENITCADCGRVARGYRLVRSGYYDRTHDHEPEFRCEKCSQKKTEELKGRGVKVH